MGNINNVLQNQLTVVYIKWNVKHRVYYFRGIVSSSKNAKKILTIFRLNSDHFMIESSINLKSLPVWLFALEIVPTYLIYSLFWLIQSSWYDIELAVYDCCMIFTSLYVLSTCLNNSPVVLCGRIGWAISVKATILKLLFIFRNPSKENNVFLIDSKRMPVPWCWIIGGISLDLAPFTLCELIEILFYSIVKRAWARDSSVYVDCIIVFAIGHVVPWAAWRIVNVRW